MSQRIDRQSTAHNGDGLAELDALVRAELHALDAAARRQRPRGPTPNRPQRVLGPARHDARASGARTEADADAAASLGLGLGLADDAAVTQRLGVSRGRGDLDSRAQAAHHTTYAVEAGDESGKVVVAEHWRRRNATPTDDDELLAWGESCCDDDEPFEAAVLRGDDDALDLVFDDDAGADEADCFTLEERRFIERAVQWLHPRANKDLIVSRIWALLTDAEDQDFYAPADGDETPSRDGAGPAAGSTSDTRPAQRPPRAEARAAPPEAPGSASGPLRSSPAPGPAEPSADKPIVDEPGAGDPEADEPSTGEPGVDPRPPDAEAERADRQPAADTAPAGPAQPSDG